MNMYMYIYVRVHVCVSMYIYINVYIRCMCVCICMYIQTVYIHMYRAAISTNLSESMHTQGAYQIVYTHTYTCRQKMLKNA